MLAPLFHLRFAVMANALTKETQRGGIPFGGQQKVYGLPHAVDGAIQVFPLTSDSALMYVSSIRQQRHQAGDPAVQRGMVNDNPPLRHHFFQVVQTE